MSKLLVTLPGTGHVAHELVKDEITLGRSGDNAIQISEDSVSSHHARLTRTAGGGFRLKDLGSTNKTWINGVAIGEVELNGMCVVRLGNVDCAFFPTTEGPLWAEAAKLRAEIGALKTEIETASKDRETLRQREKELSAAMETAKKEHAKLAEQHTAAAQKAEQFSKELAQVKNETAKISSARDAALSEKQKLSEQLNAQKKEQVLLAEKLENAEKRAEQLAAADAQAKAEIEQARASRDAAKQDVVRLSREVTTAQALADLIGKERDQLRIKHEDSVAWLNEQQAQLQKTEQQHAAALEKSEALARELAEAQQRAETLARERDTEWAQSEKLRAELFDTRTHGAAQQVAWDKERHDLTEAAHHHEIQLRASETQLVQLRGANARLVQENDEAKRSIEDLTKRWSDLLAKLQRVKEAEQQVIKMIGEVQPESLTTERNAELKPANPAKISPSLEIAPQRNHAKVPKPKPISHTDAAESKHGNGETPQQDGAHEKPRDQRKHTLAPPALNGHGKH